MNESAVSVQAESPKSVESEYKLNRLLLSNYDRILRKNMRQEISDYTKKRIIEQMLFEELVDVAQDIFDKYGITEESIDMANKKATELKEIYKEKYGPYYNPEVSSVEEVEEADPTVLSVEEVPEPTVLSVEEVPEPTKVSASEVSAAELNAAMNAGLKVLTAAAAEKAKAEAAAAEKAKAEAAEKAEAAARAAADRAAAAEPYKNSHGSLGTRNPLRMAITATAGGTLKKLKRLQKKKPHK